MSVPGTSAVKTLAHRGAIIMISASLLGGCIERQAQSGPERGSKPKIEIVGGETVNWGDTGPGILKKTVKITNAGGDTLRIGGVRPSCGCTTAPLDKQVLGPGDTATMDISMDVKTKAGQQTKSIVITSNDSTRSNLSLVLRANVQRQMVASPDIFPLISDVKPGAEGTSKIQLINTGEAPVTVQPPTMASPGGLLVRFDMTEPKTVPPGDSVEIVVHARSVRPGVNSGEVVLRSDSRINPELTVALSVNTQPQ